MAGKHEPTTKGSFYVSVATAALRFGMVIAAVVLGVFVLSRAFPTATETPQGLTEEPTVAPSPAPSPEAPPEEEEVPPEEEEVQLQGLSVQVQNGTGTTGLAAETAEALRDEVGVTIEDIGNAPRNYDTTTVFFQQGFRPHARELVRTFFNGNGEVARMPADSPADVDLIVVLGQDYEEA